MHERILKQILRACLAAAVYTLWKERNARMLQKVERTSRIMHIRGQGSKNKLENILRTHYVILYHINTVRGCLFENMGSSKEF